MRNFSLTLCYDGSRYRGWQKQGNTTNTIQSKLETLLSRMLGAEIAPRNRVLPLLRGHFCERCYNETFFIYDRTHHEALLYANGRSRIVPLASFEAAPPDAEEAAYRKLWTRFYDTIAIRERENPKLRMTHMPKRYWDTMTEFQDDDTAALPPS